MILIIVKFKKKVANIIYLQKNVIFYLKVIPDFLIRRLKAETSHFLMKNFWSTFENIFFNRARSRQRDSQISIEDIYVPNRF